MAAAAASPETPIAPIAKSRVSAPASAWWKRGQRVDNALDRSLTRSTLLVLQSGAADAAFNMALDEALLESAVRLSAPILRFYAWNEPAASFGYFQHYTDVERATHLRPLVRRPTAGGIVPH